MSSQKNKKSTALLKTSQKTKRAKDPKSKSKITVKPNSIILLFRAIA